MQSEHLERDTLHPNRAIARSLIGRLSTFKNGDNFDSQLDHRDIVFLDTSGKETAKIVVGYEHELGLGDPIKPKSSVFEAFPAAWPCRACIGACSIYDEPRHAQSRAQCEPGRT